nr:MAG TPA: hypothetical protein [Caudoviricetes sp.]
MICKLYAKIANRHFFNSLQAKQKAQGCRDLHYHIDLQTVC